MSLRVSFELDDADLRHFRLIMRAARDSTARHAPEDIVAAATALLDRIDETAMPRFVAERLAKLRLLIRMLTDLDWRLPHHDARRVLAALAYFTEAEDLIPDHVPGLGFLDDAIMIELVARELRHELDAYQDFDAFRLEKTSEIKHKSLTRRNKWLEERRRELLDRLRRRREADATGDSSSPGLFR